MAVESVKLGPGTLVIGETGTPIDASCQLVNGVVAWEADVGDDTYVLCGDVVAGARTYTSTFSGTLLEDLANESGLVAFTWANKGTEQPVTFTPNDEARATVTGILTIDPLDVGSTEDYGTPMTSDFEWTFVGDPELSWPDPAIATPANGAMVPSEESSW